MFSLGSLSLRLCNQYRTYALSRFPNRPTGSARQRQVSPKKVDPFAHSSSNYRQTLREEVPSGDDSKLWHTSQRLPTSDPEQGVYELLMGHKALIIERQIEMLNIFVGFEQCNKYSISNEAGETVGYIAEEPKGFLATVARQAFATHRPFRAIIMDAAGSPVLWLRRPFAWINSRMYVQRLQNLHDYTPEGEPVLDTFGEAQQIWHPWRRRYDLFLREGPRRVLSLAHEAQPEPKPQVTFAQIARVDAGFLAWDFRVCDANGEVIASISRAFRGFGREIFTDTGQYTVSYSPAALDHDLLQVYDKAAPRQLSLDERALILALAVNIDFDYFSRHSRVGG
ncbi:hypothetical protein AMATHDRAFT_4329 [Amanita thiersii Skay4041]|uniref:Phospholipid scramblase n=1 Tax=Amanita thiersii Skay4041 TaxID=703135 RepID=A0A2A9NL78_9AGAR|nr:hypothetical protein AMATHDRAFT_4329 [Amanita thiersii Skay4041]